MDVEEKFHILQNIARQANFNGWEKSGRITYQTLNSDIAYGLLADKQYQTILWIQAGQKLFLEKKLEKTTIKNN